MRLDQHLIHHFGARSRSQAQDWIKSGYVELFDGTCWKVIAKTAFEVTEQVTLRLNLPEDKGRFVSRAGDKLAGALEHLNQSVVGYRVLDVGASTGGFTDCLLKAGAREAVAIDVGRGQLAPSLLSDVRVSSFEGLNARYLSPEDISPLDAESAFDLIVMDVSFISIRLILPRLPIFLKTGGYLLSLVKPQFELGAEALDKRGIVKDPSLYPGLKKKIYTVCTESAFDVIDYFPSEIRGRDGNQEYFVFARK